MLFVCLRHKIAIKSREIGKKFRNNGKEGLQLDDEYLAEHDLEQNSEYGY